jgi:acetolactate synthase-1/2/3 large subunit
MFAAQYIDYTKPRQWLTSGSMGTMGFGLPAAIGAQFACPDAMVIDVDGDGSIRMNIGELETMTTYGVNVKVLLLNNTCDGMVRQWQNMMYEERYSGTDKGLHKKDFVLSAKADGFEFSERVDDRKDLKRIMKAFINFKGPAFLEVMTDIDAMIFPMVGPGKGYKEMQTGPFIVEREPEEAIEVSGTGDTAMF